MSEKFDGLEEGENPMDYPGYKEAMDREKPWESQLNSAYNTLNSMVQSSGPGNLKMFAEQVELFFQAYDHMGMLKNEAVNGDTAVAYELWAKRIKEEAEKRGIPVEEKPWRP